MFLCDRRRFQCLVDRSRSAVSRLRQSVHIDSIVETLLLSNTDSLSDHSRLGIATDADWQLESSGFHRPSVLGHRLSSVTDGFTHVKIFAPKRNL